MEKGSRRRGGEVGRCMRGEEEGVNGGGGRWRFELTSHSSKSWEKMSCAFWTLSPTSPVRASVLEKITWILAYYQMQLSLSARILTGEDEDCSFFFRFFLLLRPIFLFLIWLSPSSPHYLREMKKMIKIKVALYLHVNGTSFASAGCP